MAKTKVKRVKKVRTVEEQKSLKKKIIIIAASVLAAVLIVGIILGCIPYKSMSILDGYDYVRITHANTTDSIPNISGSPEGGTAVDANKLFDNGLKKTRYSILRSIFEGSGKNSPRFKTEKVEDPADSKKTVTQRVSMTVAEVDTALNPTSGGYLLEFKYKDMRKISVEGESVSYDTAKVFITYKQNIIEDFTVYFIDSETANADVSISERYRVNPVLIKAKVSSLYGNIEDILDLYNIAHSA